MYVKPALQSTRKFLFLTDMSKKRKRHQNYDDSTLIEDDTVKLPENTHPEANEAAFTKLLSEDEIGYVQKRIFHSVKEMGRALKKARDFEVRKIIKRMKAARWVSYVV